MKKKKKVNKFFKNIIEGENGFYCWIEFNFFQALRKRNILKNCYSSFETLERNFVIKFDCVINWISRAKYLQIFNLNEVPLQKSARNKLGNLFEMMTISCSNLHTLELKDQMLCPNELHFLNLLTNLTTLNISTSFHSKETPFSVNAFQCLCNNLINLKKIDLGGLLLNHISLSHLSSLTKLQILNLESVFRTSQTSSKASNLFFSCFSVLPLSLKSLNLFNNYFLNNEDIILLTRLTNLEMLQLHYCLTIEREVCEKVSESILKKQFFS